MRRRALPIVPALALTAAFLFALNRLSHAAIPFILALAGGYVLNPLIADFQARGLRRGVAVVALFLAVAASIYLLANTLIEAGGAQLDALQLEAPAYLARLKALLAALQARAAERLPGSAARLIAGLDQKAVAPLLQGAQQLPSYLLGVVPLLSLLFLVPFIAFFVLLDGPAGVEAAIQACPSRYVEQALHLSSEIDRSLGAYLRGLLFIAASIAAVSYLGLLLLGVKHALWISALAGISSFIPYFGALMGMLVGGLMAAFQQGTLASGLKVVVLFLAIRLGEETVIQPIVAKRSVHLHPLMFLFCFMAGGELYGFLGLVFAIPVACVLKALISVGWAWYASASRIVPAEGVPGWGVPYT